MKASDYKYRQFYSETNAVRDDDGTWKVTLDNVEKASMDGENWIQEKASVMVIDDSFDEAHKIALQSLFAWLDQNVNGRGFNSMIDAAEHFRSIEKVDDGKESNDNTHTPSESDGDKAETG